jgi:hypothetical protein
MRYLNLLPTQIPFFIVLILLTGSVYSQGVMISNDPAAPAPTALLETLGLGTGEGNILFTGEWKGAPGPAPVTGPGTRMMWYPDKAAFRTGRITGTQWDTESIGFYSTAFGFNPTASGWFSKAWGSVATATGSQSTAWGFNTVASGVSSTAWGENTTAPSFAETVFGYNNTVYTPSSATEWVATDRLFVIGNGTSSSSDALVLLKNGRLGVGTSAPTQRLEVAGTILAQTSNFAIRGIKTGTGTFPAVWGDTESTSSNATGVRGNVTSTTPGSGSAGVHGRNFGTGSNGIGVKGTHDGGGWGVFGETVSGRGVYGIASATSGTTYGVYGKSNSNEGVGVYGDASDAGIGGRGMRSIGWTGIRADGQTFGVIGTASATSGATGLRAEAPGGNNYGVYSIGNVYVSENLIVSGNKSFLIDHPHDPSGKYLYHFNTEGPEPFNIYRGSVVMDENGSARVTLPDYFEDINIDFTYHLTTVGAWAPVYVAEEINQNQFLISGGKPGLKVSWQVTAVRNDPWVRDNGYQTEVEKPEHERGTYLYPQGYGQPETFSRDYNAREERILHNIMGREELFPSQK